MMALATWQCAARNSAGSFNANMTIDSKCPNTNVYSLFYLSEFLLDSLALSKIGSSAFDFKWKYRSSSISRPTSSFSWCHFRMWKVGPHCPVQPIHPAWSTSSQSKKPGEIWCSRHQLIQQQRIPYSLLYNISIIRRDLNFSRLN